MIGSKLYSLDFKTIGIVTDILFDRMGRIKFLVISKLRVPFIGIGILRRFIPFEIVKRLGNRYVLIAPLNTLKLYFRTSSPSSIADILEKLEFRYKWFDVFIIALFITIIVALIIASTIFSMINSIILLIAASLSMVSPVILRDIFEINIPNFISFTALIGSKVFDKWCSLAIGVVTDLVLDADKSKVIGLVIEKPSIRAKQLDQLYNGEERIIIPLNLVKKVKERRIELTVSLQELTEIIKRSHETLSY